MWAGAAAVPSAVQDPVPPPTPPSFDDWLAGVRTEALTLGISEATVALALANLTPEPVIVARDRTQPELTISLDEYLESRLTAKTLSSARSMAARHRTLLDRIQRKYGIPRHVMVAIWGLESNFGQFTGVRPTITALATLAFDSRRPDLFRKELFEALRIVDRGLIPLDELKGSWAGAMGQPQFMPSSYLKYAVDFDHDGRTDIWGSMPDVFASMANYLEEKGWHTGERWGREVRVSAGAMARVEERVPMRTEGCRALREMTEPRPMADWRALGVRSAGGGRLPTTTLEASLVRGRDRNFLVYRNYGALIEYNCSNSYAITVGLLADRIGN